MLGFRGFQLIVFVLCVLLHVFVIMKSMLQCLSHFFDENEFLA